MIDSAMIDSAMRKITPFGGGWCNGAGARIVLRIVLRCPTRRDRSVTAKRLQLVLAGLNFGQLKLGSTHPPWKRVLAACSQACAGWKTLHTLRAADLTAVYLNGTDKGCAASSGVCVVWSGVKVLWMLRFHAG